MDSTLARAAWLFMRRGVHLFRPPNTARSAYRRISLVVRSRAARLGCRPHPKKCTTRHVWSIRLHTQSTLSRQFFTRPRLHDRVGPPGARAAVRGLVSWHLFTGDARRSVDHGRAFW